LSVGFWVIEPRRREGRKGFFVGFVLILKEKAGSKLYQALPGVFFLYFLVHFFFFTVEGNPGRFSIIQSNIVLATDTHRRHRGHSGNFRDNVRSVKQPILFML
jgi:hypothetical protein